MQTITTDADAAIVSDVVESLMVDYQWSLTDAISDVAEILDTTKASVFVAWIFAQSYGSPTV